MDRTEMKFGDIKVKIISPDNVGNSITEHDKEMDKRARAAVKSALEKAAVCQKPIAKYDLEKRQAYIEYPNGDREYVR